MEPEVTILIPVRNGENFIAQAIESVLEQTFTNWALVVRNNCSKDGTRAVVARYLSDPRIRLIEGDSDLSMAGNFNQCLDAVRTKYFTILCHDDYFYSPRAIEAAYEVMEAHPSVPSVFSDLMYVDSGRVPITARRFHRSGLVDCATIARGSVLHMRNLFGIPLLTRTSALGNLRYDETLPYIIDLDLSARIAKDKQVYHIPETLLANRYHAANSTRILLGGIFAQLSTMANRQKIPLSKLDRVRMKLSASYTNAARQAFMIYARGITLARSFGSRSRAANAKTAR
jgi:glycosyltransferase involved in cell wall biosynthesis